MALTMKWIYFINAVSTRKTPTLQTLRLDFWLVWATCQPLLVRKKFGLLEKHKDYVERAQAFHKKERAQAFHKNTRTMLATTLLIFLISTHMLCFVESKTEHVSSFTCSLPRWFHVRVLNEENRVLWAWFPCTETESLDSISMCRNRVQWTRFPGLRGHLSSQKLSPLYSNC